MESQNNPYGNIEYKTEELKNYYYTNRVCWDHFHKSEKVIFGKIFLNSSSKVLDVGAGCGGLGLALRERFGVVDYTGVDINMQAVKAGHDLNPSARMLCGDILKFSFDELQQDYFDTVISLGCIDFNNQFDKTLIKLFQYVKPGKYLVISLRLTLEKTIMDIKKAYQYINFKMKQEGEIAPYILLNVKDAFNYISQLNHRNSCPDEILAYGYWGNPNPTAVVPYNKVCFSVFAIKKSISSIKQSVIKSRLPDEIQNIVKDTSIVLQEL